VYAKVFHTLWHGSLAGKHVEQNVFIFLLAHADRHGVVDIHPRSIAASCGLDVDRVRVALDYLEGPDPESRSSEHGGARLIRLDQHRDWGWVIVNHSKYMYLKDMDEKRAGDAERARKYRERQKERCGASRPVTRNHTSSRHTDTDTDTDIASPTVKPLSTKSPFKIPTEEEVAIYCSSKGIVLDAAQFVAFYQSKGWKVGNQPMRDWRAAVTTWTKRRQQESAGKPRGVTAGAMMAFGEKLRKEGR
jgi:hypothetical protein